MAIYSLGRGTMQRIDVPENHAKNSLPIGTVCHWSGYGDHKMIIVKNCGISESFPEYGARYEMINLGTLKRSGGHNSSSLRHISQKFGIGIYLTDEKPYNDDQIESLLQAEKEQIELDILAGIEKATKSIEYKERILKEFAHLEKIAPGTHAGVKTGSKNIKSELKKAFPLIKFSVTGEHFSMGNAIRISWTDGPATKDVEAITNKYQEGHFNGMEDIYEDGNDVFNDIFGGAKYVTASRSLSDAAYNSTAIEAGYPSAVFNSKTGTFDGVDYEINEMIKRMAWEKRF